MVFLTMKGGYQFKDLVIEIGRFSDDIEGVPGTTLL